MKIRKRWITVHDTTNEENRKLLETFHLPDVLTDDATLANVVRAIHNKHERPGMVIEIVIRDTFEEPL